MNSSPLRKTYSTAPYFISFYSLGCINILLSEARDITSLPDAHTDKRFWHQAKVRKGSMYVQSKTTKVLNLTTWFLCLNLIKVMSERLSYGVWDTSLCMWLRLAKGKAKRIDQRQKDIVCVWIRHKRHMVKHLYVWHRITQMCLHKPSLKKIISKGCNDNQPCHLL